MGGRPGHLHRGAALAISRSIRPIADADRPRVAEFITRQWESSRMAAHGKLFDVPKLSGFIAEMDGEWVGHLAYAVQGQMLEIVVIGTPEGQRGVGSALIAEAARLARNRGLNRIWLTTTNDNLDALRFYQRRGFLLAALERGAVDVARRSLKPEIPLTGSYGIPIRDELQLELPRGEWDDLIARYGW